MRIRINARPRVLFGLFFVIALIGTLPMRLALGALGLDREGLTLRAAEHSVWAATLREVHWGEVDLGDSYAALSPIQLLVGRARVDLSGPKLAQGERLRGAFSVSASSFGIDDASAAVPVGALFAPLPITRLDLSDVSVRFDRGRCARANGRVKAELGAGIAGISLGQGMSGEARCVGGALNLPLASQSGAEKIGLSVQGDGRYRALLDVTTSDPAVIDKLNRAGFLAVGGGYRLSVEGRL